LSRLVWIAVFVLGATCPAVRAAQYAQTQGQQAVPQNIFHVKYVSEGAVYVDAGRNAGLEEGMVLHLVHAAPNGGTTEAVRFQDQEPVADVRIFSVADSSAAAEIVKSREDIVPGDIAYLDVQSIHTREDKINEAESQTRRTIPSWSPFPTAIRSMKKSARRPFPK
jgi:hypothetical protein